MLIKYLSCQQHYLRIITQRQVVKLESHVNWYRVSRSMHRLENSGNKLCNKYTISKDYVQKLKIWKQAHIESTHIA